MTRLLRFFRKMNVILFMSILLYSMIFIYLVSSIDQFNWQQLFHNFQSKDLEKFSYLIAEDMRREGITEGPLTDQQENWLRRRAALYGVLLNFENKNRDIVWFDTFSKARHPVSGEVKELPYLSQGEVRGHLRLAYILDNNQLDPAYVEFRQSKNQRSQILFIAVLLFSIVFSYLIARSLTKHLKHVYNQTHEIGLGNRDVVIPLKGPEEVRRLALTLNEMTHELKKQEDWRHHLMEDITHELRTPLTSLLTQIEAVVDGVFEADQERMEDIYEELVRLSRLVDDLEQLSEAESARFTLNPKRTDMVQLVKRVYTIYFPVARGKNIKLLFEAANVPCYAEVDRDKVVQVVSNLVMNAIKYTPDGGKVRLSVDWNYDETIIYCEDNGLGISPTDLPYIFNRLYRADKSRSRFSGGVGLGLSIAKALVDAHDGTISATSVPGEGSRFTVILPNIYKPYKDDEKPRNNDHEE